MGLFKKKKKKDTKKITDLDKLPPITPKKKSKYRQIEIGDTLPKLSSDRIFEIMLNMQETLRRWLDELDEALKEAKHG